MNGHGKSDRPVVPMKSPNNAGQPVAEEMEGRGLAKGNLQQQNAPRTLSRQGAPSALERVRQAASILRGMRRRVWTARRGGTTASDWRKTSGSLPIGPKTTIPSASYCVDDLGNAIATDDESSDLDAVRHVE